MHLPEVQSGRGPAAGGRQIRRRLLVLGGGAAEGGRAEDGTPVDAAGCGEKQQQHCRWQRVSVCVLISAVSSDEKQQTAQTCDLKCVPAGSVTHFIPLFLWILFSALDQSAAVLVGSSNEHKSTHLLMYHCLRAWVWAICMSSCRSDHVARRQVHHHRWPRWEDQSESPEVSIQHPVLLPGTHTVSDWAP